MSWAHHQPYNREPHDKTPRSQYDILAATAIAYYLHIFSSRRRCQNSTAARYNNTNPTITTVVVFQNPSISSDGTLSRGCIVVRAESAAQRDDSTDLKTAAETVVAAF